MKYSDLKPSEARELFRSGAYTGHTAGFCGGYLQANVAILHKDLADDFRKFCDKNSKAAPLLEQLAAGSPTPKYLAPNADIRTDLPKYSHYNRSGICTELLEIRDIWNNDFVTFFLGCSFSFELALQKAGIPMRHIELNRVVPMFCTNIPTQSVGGFSGPLVVSMRPIPKDRIGDVTNITGAFPKAHGSPVHHGDPTMIGIEDIQKPDYGESVPIYANEVPVFWACGMTVRLALKNALKMGLAKDAISHAPGHMFITDILAKDP